MRILTAVLALATVNQLNLSRQAAQPVTNSAVFATHSQIQQAGDLRCASRNGSKAYTCAPCPPTGVCNTGIGPNPVVTEITYGMELQFINDVPCTADGASCTLDVDNLGIMTIYTNDGGSTPATFLVGFHRVVADLVGSSFVWRLEY
jgi:hypothetical protein